MSAFSWIARIRLLPPRDAEFYRLFDEMTGKLVRASDLLVELVSDCDDDRLHRLANAMKQLETECDGIVGQTITQLEISPQPPFERDDITHLIKSLDDVMDWIERFSNRFVMYRGSIDRRGIEQLRELAGIVQGSCVKVRDAVSCLARHRRHVDDHVLAIHKLETQADEIHHGTLARRNSDVEELFRSVEESLRGLRIDLEESADQEAIDTETLERRQYGAIRTLEVIVSLVHGMYCSTKLLELLSSLERASDASDTVATTVKRMVMKNV